MAATLEQSLPRVRARRKTMAAILDNIQKDGADDDIPLRNKSPEMAFNCLEDHTCFEILLLQI
jgi:hypothetical protein